MYGMEESGDSGMMDEHKKEAKKEALMELIGMMQNLIVKAEGGDQEEPMEEMAEEATEEAPDAMGSLMSDTESEMGMGDQSRFKDYMKGSKKPLNGKAMTVAVSVSKGKKPSFPPKSESSGKKGKKNKMKRFG